MFLVIYAILAALALAGALACAVGGRAKGIFRKVAGPFWGLLRKDASVSVAFTRQWNFILSTSDMIREHPYPFVEVQTQATRHQPDREKESVSTKLSVAE